AALHRVCLVLADEHGVLGRFADESRLATQIAVALGALAGHEDLRVHPDWEIFRFDADHRTHTGHAVRSDRDDLAGTLQAAVNAVPLPVRRSLARARDYALVALQPCADQ